MIAPLGLALVAAQVLSSQSSFPETAVRELATLRPGVTPAAWLQGSPRDSLARFTRALVRDNHDRWCARASRREGEVVRYAYFYPPAPPASLALPSDGGPDVIRGECVLGVIWLEVAVPDSAVGASLAGQTRDALTRAYGPVTPASDVWAGRTPSDSQRRLLRRVPGADALRLGLHFFGAGGWRVPGRWQRDSTVIASALDLGFRAGAHGRVLAFASLPIAELGSVRRESEGVARSERRGAAVARQAAEWSGMPPSRVHRLLDFLARSESAFTGQAGAPGGTPDSTLLAVFEDWIGGARLLAPPARAAALLAADQVLWSGAVFYARAQADDSATRRALEGLGAAFVEDPLGGGYNYTHTWLDEALRLDPEGRVGTLATLALMRLGFDQTGMCGGGETPFRRVTAAGERLLTRPLDPATAAEVHLLVARGYADIVALAAGGGSGYADSAAYMPEATAARAQALAHYRRSLALDPSSVEARAAWLEAWRLAAGLAPVTTRYFCVYD